VHKINTFAAFVFLLLSATLVSAQATRTWVSGVGDDANPCSRTAPCKTWAGAIAKTAPGGEIDALDPGGFGALTITKSITLDGGGGQVASVLVAGTNGITVAAQSNDVVTIRNLRLDGLLGNGTNSGNAGLTGISFLSGKVLNIENVNIFGFNTAGISANLGAAASLSISNTVIENTGTCTPASCGSGVGDGIFVASSSGLIKVQITDSAVFASSNNGIEAGANSRIVVHHSKVENSGASGITASASSSQATISFSDVDFNVNGLTATAGGSANVAFSNFAYNTSCGLNNSGGSLASFGNNRLIGAAVCGTVSSANQQ
jgi:hypothetical protein